MPRNSKPRQQGPRGTYQQMRLRIAAVAARMMAEDGIDDFATAKRKAARQLGVADTQALPGNDEVEAELRAYQTLYQGDELRERLQFLRAVALDLMEVLIEFRPYLSGPVLKGTAGRYSEIDLQLFTDDSKALEIFLLNRNIPYDVTDIQQLSGGLRKAVSVLQLEWEDVPVNVAVYAINDERILKSSPSGRPLERAGLQAVAQLLEQDE
jgi:hypothetical protein